MKVSYVVVAGVLSGAMLGVGLTWDRFGNAPRSPLPVAGPLTVGAPSGDVPKVAVERRAFEFGAIERGIEVRHVFRIQNVGRKTLTLEAGGTTCSKCTIAEVDKPELAPGEWANITVAYMPGDVLVFRQLAWVKTNDAEEPRVEFVISGSVNTRYQLIPTELVLSKVSANETRHADVKVIAFFADTCEVASHELLDADTAPYFEVAFEPLSAEQAAEHKAKSGCLMAVTLKPGLPLGPFRQTIRLRLRTGGDTDSPTAEVPIRGTIDSDISIVGAGWNSGAGRLSIGEVKIAEGASTRLTLLVRGDQRHDVTIKPTKMDPEWLKVVVGEPSDLSSGGVTQIPLTIEIPPNSPPVNHLGTDQGRYAEVVLETTHPDIKQIRIYVKFVTVP